MKLLGVAGALCWLVVTSASMGSELVYTPINPSFGGNPNNSAHLFALANAQRNATAADATSSSGGGTGTGGDGGTGTTQSQADLFVSQLEGRLLSALASQVTDAIFGANPQDSGTVTFGTTTVSFLRGNGQIELDIFDGDTGTTTQIIVPTLVAGP